MSDRVSWITHQSKKILFVDTAGLRDETYLQVLDEVEKVYQTLPQQSTLVLIDVTDSVSSVETTEKQKALAAYRVAKHAAVVGVTGLKMIIARAVRRDFYYATSLEDGKDWLVRQ
jgi:hypothetical protein